MSSCSLQSQFRMSFEWGSRKYGYQILMYALTVFLPKKIEVAWDWIFQALALMFLLKLGISYCSVGIILFNDLNSFHISTF